MRSMLAQDSIVRGRKFTELLHRAASVGGLDNRSRCDVAVECARSCLVGTKVIIVISPILSSSLITYSCRRIVCFCCCQETQWGENDISDQPRLRFPRKAAFFTIIAAEAMSNSDSLDAGSRASNLYLAASQLYSREGNEHEDGGDKMIRYGWATLRSETLVGLSSQPSDVIVAEAGEFLQITMWLLHSVAGIHLLTLSCSSLHIVAIELLMALLGEIAPNQLHENLLVGQEEGGRIVGIGNQYSFEQENKSFADDSYHGNAPSSSSKAKQVSKPLASMTGSKTPFFSQAPPSALSLSQSKWLEDDPIPHAQLPFVDAGSSKNKSSAVAANKGFVDRATALDSSVSTMKSVTTRISFNLCSKMQQLCIQHLEEIRQKMAASSDEEIVGSECGGNESFLPPPLVVTSAKIVKADSHLVVERTKALGYSAKFATHSMSTFFNPYAKAKAEKDKNKVVVTLVCEGEERAIMVEFKNRLAVPLQVPSCMLEFDGKGAEQIEAPPLSFTVPAKTNSFAVHFPFIVSVAKTSVSNEMDPKDPAAIPEPSLLCVSGLRVTCLNRTFPIKLRKGDEEASAIIHETQLPAEGGRYMRSKHTQPAQDEQQMAVQLESVPAQPNLLVSFANSQSPMEDDVNLPVHLSEGEIYTIPSFRYQHSHGSLLNILLAHDSLIICSKFLFATFFVFQVGK